MINKFCGSGRQWNLIPLVAITTTYICNPKENYRAHPKARNTKIMIMINGNLPQLSMEKFMNIICSYYFNKDRTVLHLYLNAKSNIIFVDCFHFVWKLIVFILFENWLFSYCLKTKRTIDPSIRHNHQSLNKKRTQT